MVVGGAGWKGSVVVAAAGVVGSDPDAKGGGVGSSFSDPESSVASLSGTVSVVSDRSLFVLVLGFLSVIGREENAVAIRP